MKRKTFVFTLILVLILLSIIPVSAQFTGKGKDYILVLFMANVKGANVYINNAKIGVTPLKIGLKPGTYSLTISKAGYGSYLSKITVRKKSNQIFKATLTQSVSVKISSNVTGAAIQLNNQNRGTTPSALTLSPGRYQLKLSAAGYKTLVTTLTVTTQSKQNYSFMLEHLMATLNVLIPDQFIDFRSKSNAIRIFIDDTLMNPKQDLSQQLLIRPGMHNIRIVSPAGGLTISKDFMFQAGQHYVIELFMDLLLK